MSIETTILDFQLSNTFEQYESHMKEKEQQTMFKEIGAKTLYVAGSLFDPKRATVIFKGLKMFYMMLLCILKQNL